MHKMKNLIGTLAIALTIGLCVSQVDVTWASEYDYSKLFDDNFDEEEFLNDYYSGEYDFSLLDEYYENFDYSSGEEPDFIDYYRELNSYESLEYKLYKGIVNVKHPTQKQIKKKWKSLKMKGIFSKADKMAKKPKNSGKCSLGKVSDATLKDAVNVLNMYRFIAGVPSNVVIDKSYQELAQAAAVVNYNDKSSWISHYPNKPSGMSDSLYEKGKNGASSSNLAAGYGNIKKSIYGWMSDSDYSNIDRLGHRRWCINPTMDSTGFGIDGDVYSMYAFARNNTEGAEVHGVAWPAKNTPIELWDKYDAWSISMGVDVPSATKVTLTRVKDNKTWKFSANSSSAGYFNIDNAGYGQSGCIIFRPDNITYKKGDKFKVKVKGDGFSFEYDVNFFSVE